MRLWLDDVRPAPVGFDIHVKTAPEAIRLLASGKVTEVSLDHDLGMSDNPSAHPGTGYDVAVWIEENAYQNSLLPLKWNVHSANPVGRRKMEMALGNADKYWESSSKETEAMTKHPEKIKFKGATYRLAMDPNAALKHARDLANALVDREDLCPEAVEMAETFLGLDEWLGRQGFKPSDWDHE